MNELIHDGDPEMRRPGETRQQNEQLLFAAASYDRRLLASWVTLDHRDMRISVEADLLSKDERGEVLDAVESYLVEHLPAEWSYELTGPLTLFAEMVAALHSTQLRSFTTAALLISLLVAIFLRSVSAAAWVMIPTAVPVAVTLGAMGLLDVPLDTGTAMIAAIVLGIGVDDSVHLVTRYKGHRSLGRERREAMRRSTREVGRALVASSLALAAGFLAMLLSSWGGIATFGLLSACAITLALLADLFLLPAIVFLVARRQARPGEEGPRAERSRPEGRIRAVLVVLVTASSLVLFSKVGVEVLRADDGDKPACGPLENGVVPLSAAVAPGCPLRAYEVVRSTTRRGPGVASEGDGSMTFLVASGGQEVPVSVPVIPSLIEERWQALGLVGAVSGFFLFLCLAIFWQSPAAAATPLIAISAAAIPLACGVALGPWSTTAARAGTLGLAFLPFALFHLALCFPGERPLIRSTARFPLVIYAPGVVVAAVALATYFRFPDLFRVVSQLLVGLVIAGGAAILAGSVSALRGSRSALHRARARVLLWGLFGVGATGIVLLGATPSVLDRVPGGRPGAIYLAMLAGLLPLAYTVHRYHLFDVRAHAATVLRLATRGASYVALIILFSAVLGDALEGAFRIGVAAVLAWAAMEIVSGAVWGRATRWRARRSQEMSTLGVSHARRIYALSARSELAAELRKTVLAALRPDFVTVFLRGPSGWYPADAWGNGPTEERIASLASNVAPTSYTVCLAEEERERSRASEALRDVGIETIVPLGDMEERSGMLVLGPVPELLSTSDREFLETLAAQTVTGLAWADAAEQLGQARAVARSGFLAASLTHELGKPINNVWTLARSALKPGRNETEVRARLIEIQQFADQALAIVDRLFQQAQTSSGGAHSRPLGEVVTLACQQAEANYRHPVVAQFQDVMMNVESDFEISQALLALLGNACRESPETAPVEVSVSASRQHGVRIEVADHGAGMDDYISARAFEPWFTTRHDEGGRGLGLALCRLLIRQIGGVVEIVSSEPGKGTRMRILLPASIISGHDA